ncbi:MAG: hypothetical protein KC486_22050, partial [Myxococcales bacterium]|nr:hypothetical protein [Myxococcales bacterium]
MCIGVGASTGCGDDGASTTEASATTGTTSATGASMTATTGSSASAGTESTAGETDAMTTTGSSATGEATESATSESESASSDTATTDTTTGGVTPACDPAGGSDDVAAPELLLILADRWEEGWLGSPAVADLDGDGTNEIIVPRGNALIVWGSDGSLRSKTTAAGGRIWASPVVADLTPDPGLEIAFAARENLYILGADGAVLPGFPVAWEDELRSLAAGDVDGDGDLELFVLEIFGGGASRMHLFQLDGSEVAGWPLDLP